MTGDSYGAAKRDCELELLNGDTGGMGWTVLRPNHIYGPGSELGCLPCHGRDPKLIESLRKSIPLKLVGGGHFLQQPIFAADLAELILSVKDRPQANRQIFFAAGPEIIESREYYRIIARALEVDLQIEEVSVHGHLEAHPEAAPFLCHRVYDLARLRSTGASMPRTPIERGLQAHVESLLARH